MTIGRLVTPTIKLVRKLDEGGMGTVWAAENLALGSLVAVKLLTRSYVDEETSIARFKQEAQRAARVRSPHVATVFDHGMTAEGEPYIVMELLEGETLDGRIKRNGTLPIEDVEKLVGQIAKALNAAHKLGVVHRDIKPKNLFVVDNEGEPFVKVVDFGIAKQMDVPPDLTTTNMMMGTPPYMSPEQYMNPKAVDLRSDLWSLGVVVYEAITSVQPFTGETPMAVAMAITRGMFKPPSEIKPDIPWVIDRWISKALAVDPEKRFGSAIVMAEALCKAFNNNSGSPKTPSASPVAAANGEAPTVPASMRPPPLVKPTPGKEENRGARPSTPPDNMKLLNALPLPLGTQPRLEFSEDTRRGFHSLRLPGTVPKAMAFDEGGSLLCVGFTNGNLLCLDLSTNRPRWWHQLVAQPNFITVAAGRLGIACADGVIRLYKLDGGNQYLELAFGTRLHAIAFAHDGGRVAAVGKDGIMSLWSSRSGRLKKSSEQTSKVNCFTSQHTDNFWVAGEENGTIRIWQRHLQPVTSFRVSSKSIDCIAASPDGKQFAIGHADGSVAIWDKQSGTISRTLTGHAQRISSLAFFYRNGILLSASVDGTVRYWDLAVGKTLVTLGSPENSAGCLAISRVGWRSALSFSDGTIRIYDRPMDLLLSEG